MESVAAGQEVRQEVSTGGRGNIASSKLWRVYRQSKQHTLEGLSIAREVSIGGCVGSARRQHWRFRDRARSEQWMLWRQSEQHILDGVSAEREASTGGCFGSARSKHWSAWRQTE